MQEYVSICVSACLCHVVQCQGRFRGAMRAFPGADVWAPDLCPRQVSHLHDAGDRVRTMPYNCNARFVGKGKISNTVASTVGNMEYPFLQVPLTHNHRRTHPHTHAHKYAHNTLTHNKHTHAHTHTHTHTHIPASAHNTLGANTCIHEYGYKL